MSKIMWKSLKFLKLSNYEINKTGEVRNIVTNKILNGTYNICKMYGLTTDNGELIKYSEARLVAHAFLGEPADKNFVVNHKDNDIKNNNVDNLEWSSRIIKRNEKLDDKYTQYDNKGQLVYIWNSAKEAATYYNISIQGIYNSARKNVLYKGYKWVSTNTYKIRQYTLNDILVKEFNSVKEAAIFMGGSYKLSAISKCCLGHGYQAYGYKWKREMIKNE